MDEGTIDMKLGHVDRDWQTNRKRYEFSEIRYGSVRISAVKRSDRKLEVRFATELAMHTFVCPMPKPSPGLKIIAVTWKDDEIKLFVDGKHVESAPYKPAVLH